MTLQVRPIASRHDNYIWCITRADNKHAWVVDPGEAQPVFDFLSQHDYVLEGALITHHHPDHTEGLQALQQSFPSMHIYAGLHTRHPLITMRVTEGETLCLSGLDLTLSVIETPGHTLDHICYFNETILFCGDTLFSAGCGRLFEGSPTQMLTSLQKLNRLSPATSIYCAHEYTAHNLLFAAAVEPENPAISAHSREIAYKRQNGQPSLPSTLALEQRINPFYALISLKCKK